ncbi:hypothetical protein LXL04_008390 [Taraxacum kok-saghyz]
MRKLNHTNVKQGCYRIYRPLPPWPRWLVAVVVAGKATTAREDLTGKRKKSTVTALDGRRKTADSKNKAAGGNASLQRLWETEGIAGATLLHSRRAIEIRGKVRWLVVSDATRRKKSPVMSDVGRACRRSDHTWSRRRSKAGREEMALSGFLVTMFEDGEAVRVYSGNSNSEMRPPLSPAISEQGVDEEWRRRFRTPTGLIQNFRLKTPGVFRSKLERKSGLKSGVFRSKLERLRSKSVKTTTPVPVSMKRCEMCKSFARMYCESDNASLCYDCDQNNHLANFLD